MIEGFPPGALVVLHLVNPKEKFWGAVTAISDKGVSFRGINLESFNDWVRQLSRREEEPTMDLATMFVPLFRVEKIFLDEAIGAVRSYSDYFEEAVGIPAAGYVGVDRGGQSREEAN